MINTALYGKALQIRIKIKEEKPSKETENFELQNVFTF